MGAEACIPSSFVAAAQNNYIKSESPGSGSPKPQQSVQNTSFLARAALPIPTRASTITTVVELSSKESAEPQKSKDVAAKRQLQYEDFSPASVGTGDGTYLLLIIDTF